MRLYPKKLSSVEEIKREQLRLKYERLHTKASDLMPLKEVGRKKKGGKAADNLLGTILEVAQAESWVHALMALGGPAMRMMARRQSKNGFLKKAFMEVLTGYLLGKTIEMGWHGIKLFVRSRKRKKLRAREQERPYPYSHW